MLRFSAYLTALHALTAKAKAITACIVVKASAEFCGITPLLILIALIASKAYAALIAFVALFKASVILNRRVFCYF